MLHPVGDLPAAVYWRRRALVLILLLSVLGGGGWSGYALLSGRDVGPVTTVAAASAPLRPPATPALERVAPAVAAVRLPPRYARCPDAALAVRVTAPLAVPAGSGAAFRLVVTNTSAVPCTRTLDRGLQELALFDQAGHRIWDSNDCVPLAGSDARTLAPREAVSVAVAWDGRTSERTCTAQKTAPPAGRYVLRARLDTVSAPETPLAVG